MHAWRVTAIVIFIICSCSTEPPQRHAVEALGEYSRAGALLKTEPEKSCQIFLDLAEKKDFVLKDVAYVRSLQNCDMSTHVLNWDRSVPPWLEKEKSLMFFKTLKTPVDKALFVQKNPQFFPTPDRVQMYQAAVAVPDISPDNKKILQDSLFSLAPRFMPQPPDKELFKIVKDYRSVRDFGKAKMLLTKIIVGHQFSWDEKYQATKEMFFTLKLQKDQQSSAYMKSAKAWAGYVKPDKSMTGARINQYYDAQINYLRVIWTERGADESLKLIPALQKNLQGRHSLYELYWLRARMLEEKKSLDEAVASLELALKENISQWRDKEKILWSLAWIYYKNGKPADAERHLATLVDSSETSAWARFKYLYWKGEALAKQGKNDEARAAWERVVNEDIFGYYNLLAHARLEQPLRTYEIKSYAAKPLLGDDDEKIFSALQQVDELELAARLLLTTTRDPSTMKTASADDFASLFAYHARVHDYKFIFQVFNQLTYEQQRDIFLKIPRQIFPEPYESDVSQAAGKTGLDPALIYSIMRQESSFDPRARSPMDAFGLLQLLPEVAKRLARDNHIAYSGYDDLYDEKTNIPLGSLLLKKQMANFGNHFVLAVASYNASSGAVRKWHERYTGDDLMFIEDIPYEETKAYVKLVLRNFILYKKLAMGDAFKNFPRELIARRDELPPTPPAITTPAAPPPPPSPSSPSSNTTATPAPAITNSTAVPTAEPPPPPPPVPETATPEKPAE